MAGMSSSGVVMSLFASDTVSATLICRCIRAVAFHIASRDAVLMHSGMKATSAISVFMFISNSSMTKVDTFEMDMRSFK